MTRLDFAHVYEGLKDFQLATVRHVTDRLYGDDATDRFLVADEVGLGKTLVARGVIAKSIEHHVEIGTDRIDVVYICSNADIARQNVGRLNVLERNDFNLATRITLLPRILRDLEANRINFVSFTPGTSFNLRSSEGIVQERVLLYHMLRQHWGEGVVGDDGPDKRVFAGSADFENFYRYIERGSDGFDASLAEKFGAALDRAEARLADRSLPTLREQFESLRDRFAPVRTNDGDHVPSKLRGDRAHLVGELRELLAHTCVEALEPDLVILDEFQRFKHLFTSDNPAGELAEQLFAFPDVKVLLLSATPYKMYTLSDEPDDDHYADFLDTLSFLLDDEEVTSFAQHLRDYRRALFDLGSGDGTQARRAKERIEDALQGVMARTERLAVTADRSGMLQELPSRRLELTTDDVRQYVAADELSERLGTGRMLDYWKATPYPMSFMEGYQVDRRLEQTMEGGDARWLLDMARRPGLALDWDDVRRYQQVDPANVRLRSLAADTVDRGAWRLLWIPPSMPYYRLAGAYGDRDLEGFTKRLVFSAWRVVPKVIGAMLSYEAERQMLHARGERVENTPEFRSTKGNLLQLTRSGGRLTGMPVFALLHPSPALAELGDPRRVAADLGGYARAPSQRDVLDHVRDAVAARLRPQTRAAPAEGQVDERWYWAAPLLLDRLRDAEGTARWFSDPLELAQHVVEPGEDASTSVDSGWLAHIEEAAEFVRGEAEPLGRVPDDLIDVVAELALAGPAVCALRALGRITSSDTGVDDQATRKHAGAIAWSLRHLFNLVDATYLLRSSATGGHKENVYWRLVLRYCLDGCLQAVLDEYIHVVKEWRGVTGVTGEQLLEPITETVREALTLRTVNYGVRRIVDDAGSPRAETERMRGMFALQFGDARSDDQKSMQRSSSVRAAFNSPFRPFVLATTSVGQEGLDFHTYCHAVVHWNLPANPVDLEQREGRVHRYKGHAVRRNVAADHRARALGDEADPWAAMFASATQSRDARDNELVPFWVYPGDATIERYVPALPLSRDSRRLEQLRKSLAAYRLVFGQPRQEDLVAYLQDRMDPDELSELLGELQVNVAPRPLGADELDWWRSSRPFEVEAAGLPEKEQKADIEHELSSSQLLCRRFWKPTLEVLSLEYPKWVSDRAPPKNKDLRLRAGITGIQYSIVFAGGERLRVELYISRDGDKLQEETWKHFNDERSAIEERLGRRLTYEELSESHASRIASYYPGAAELERESDWPRYWEWIVDEIGPFRAAVQPSVDALTSSG